MRSKCVCIHRFLVTFTIGVETAKCKKKKGNIANNEIDESKHNRNKNVKKS